MTPERQKEIIIFESSLCHTSFISSLLRIGAPQHEQLHSGRSSFKFSLFNNFKASITGDRNTDFEAPKM